MSQLCLLQVLMGDTCIASQDAFEQHVKNTFLSIFQMFEIFCYRSEEPCMQILFLDVSLTFVHDLCAFVFQYFNMAKSLHAFSKHHTEIAHIQSKIYHSPTQCQSYSKILFTQVFGGQWHIWKEIFLVSNRFCMPFTRMSRNFFFAKHNSYKRRQWSVQTCQLVVPHTKSCSMVHILGQKCRMFYVYSSLLEAPG